ncbi:MAG: N-6 DNA methylase, partial [Actinomycetota bacterium]|nr:N-6 DNA methylase [Actinomycetota bacterium]
MTRERWLLPLFRELGYGQLLSARAVEIEGKSYPISHAWQHAPIHLVGFRTSLDKRTPGVAGAARVSPHGLVQEFLNRSDDRLWGFLSDGLGLRILRDNASLTRQAYVEFDLEAMMDGEVYPDFVLLWLLCHQSRVEAERPEECYLEQWSYAASEQGTRALEGLRDGVEEAIASLGSGFLSHRANDELKEKLRSGELEAQDYYRQLLRLVYRLLFLFVAEDRNLLLDPDADDAARERYIRFYSTRKLRDVAEKRVGARHSDLYKGLSIVMEKLGEEDGYPELGLPALGGFLFSLEAMPDLAGAEVSNRDLLDAVRALSLVEYDGSRRPVDYKNLGAEELGSVYESLLELQPELDSTSGAFNLRAVSGNERKTTGSYYTPHSLVTSLLDTALDPVLNETARKPDPEAAILDLKVCDPAVGSGHFLIAAAHRMARRLASVRTGDDEPSPHATREALGDVIGRCLYGVDVNPMAAELCKVSLWMEALVPGKPLSFLDHHIQVGNSLLGATPDLIADGIPNEAFKPIAGDDKQLTNAYRKRNREEREARESGQLSFSLRKLDKVREAIERGYRQVEEGEESSVAEIREKAARYAALQGSGAMIHARRLADAWCAAFVWPKKEGAPETITQGVFAELTEDAHAISHQVEEEIERIVERYNFFHWHLAFPNVFDSGAGGFDVVLGNPPWEQTELKEQE